MWTYHQSTGQLHRNGKLVETGYSGAGKTKAEGRNNPAMEGVATKGPIPRGRYKIAKPRTSPTLGPWVLDLTPVGHNALGRSLFRIHGDNAANNASHGCIIVSRRTREAITASGDTELEVLL